MEKIHRYDTVSEYNALNNHPTLHPLVSVIDLAKANPRDWGGAKTAKLYFGLYCIFLKDVKCGDLKYGCQYYDYQEGTLVFVAPGQVVEIENADVSYQPTGHGLVFHPDLLPGTALATSIHDYHFFSYKTNEALHLSDRERQIILDCLAKITFELQQPVDKHSKKLIAANIELFLNYAERFYDRQFITREVAHQGILAKFEQLLNSYFLSDKPQLIGIPSVAHFADSLNLSANYFGDLVKRETGQSAKQFIQLKLIEAAKDKILGTDKTVNEIAYELGFKYPQHFSRFFKEQVGHPPNEYRSLN
jgi:AraC-like DNA-binding protein